MFCQCPAGRVQIILPRGSDRVSKKTLHCQSIPKNVVAAALMVESDISPNLVLHHPVVAQFSRGARAMWTKFRGNCVRVCGRAAAGSERGESACLTWNEEGGDGDSEDI